MRKRELVIDTQFQQFDSTDIREQECYQEPKEIDYLVLDLYYQGIQKVLSVFDRREADGVIDAFNTLRHYRERPRLKGRDTQSKYGARRRENQRRCDQQEGGHPRQRQYSESIDRINMLSEIADKFIQTRRLKSQVKPSSKASITSKESKKILSKLNKLQGMIMDIRRQNQVSNQGSIVYTTRSRHPGQFIPDNRFGYQVPVEQEYMVRPRVYSTVVNSGPADYYQPYSTPSQRYYIQKPQKPQIQTFGEYRVSPSLLAYQDRFVKERVASVYQKNITLQNTRNVRENLNSEDEDQEMSESLQSRQKDNLKLELQEIWQQMNELRNANKQHIIRNTALIEEVRSRQDRQPNVLQKQGREIVNREQFVRKESQSQKQQFTQKHQVPYLNLPGNIDPRGDIRDIRKEGFIERQVHQQTYADRNNQSYYPVYHNEPPNYNPGERIQTQQYNTPLNQRPLQACLPSNHICGQCGCRCQEPHGVYSRYQGL